MEEAMVRAVNGSDGNTSRPTTLYPLYIRKVPFIGYPGPLFATWHISGLITFAISNIVSLTLITFLCGCCRRKPAKAKAIKERSGSRKQKSDGTSGDSDSHKEETTSQSSSVTIIRKGKPAPSNTQHIRYFWQWNVGERFVLYLAACDVGFGISHSIDMFYIYYFVDYPPDLLCAFLGFLLHQFMVSQWFVITISSISACSLVVFGKKICLGRWDWRLFAFAVVLQLVVGVFGIVYRIFGATGSWCYINIGTVNGLRYNMVVNVFQIILYLVVSIAYVTIWFKIRRTTGLLEGSSTKRYQNSARMMLIFVAVFIFQWSSYFVFNIWVLFGIPHPVFLVIDGILTNFGGVYNCLAYTIIRRRLQKQAKESGGNVVVSDGRNAKHNALDRTPTTSATSVAMEIH